MTPTNAYTGPSSPAYRSIYQYLRTTIATGTVSRPYSTGLYTPIPQTMYLYYKWHEYMQRTP
ncbi:hypothetical protein GcC1_125025 [Golovinomyces cichoracearum]|uniref:Uncharacterized protein n=1 Tax=Golovinomyces cichoracearum TaxID=62708 RepID=A0A420I638_9PEZI|nr:hypothetical protein GcC1_125025 [Golovinomyces cichoracearum]